MNTTRKLATAALTAAAIAATTTPAHAATSGNGWAIEAPWITHLDSKPWTIVFHDVTTRTKMSYHAKLTAAELTKYTGVKVTVATTIQPMTLGACPAAHTMILKYDTASTRSAGSPCHTADGAANGGYIRFSAANWNRTSWSTQTVGAYHRNVVSHEMGHLFGLGHPISCGTTKPLPLMCGEKWGGYSSTTYGGKYTPKDINGLKALVANRSTV